MKKWGVLLLILGASPVFGLDHFKVGVPSQIFIEEDYAWSCFPPMQGYAPICAKNHKSEFCLTELDRNGNIRCVESI